MRLRRWYFMDAQLMVLGMFSVAFVRSIMPDRPSPRARSIYPNFRLRYQPAATLLPAQAIFKRRISTSNAFAIAGEWRGIRLKTVLKSPPQRSLACSRPSIRRRRPLFYVYRAIADVMLESAELDEFSSKTFEQLHDVQSMSNLDQSYREMVAKAMVIAAKKQKASETTRGASIWLDAEELDYWSDPANVLGEVKAFWRAKGIESDKVPNTILALNFASHALRLIMRRSGGPEAMARWLGVEAIPSHQVEAEQTEELVQLRQAGNFGGPGPGSVNCTIPLDRESADGRKRRKGHRFPLGSRKPRGYWQDIDNLRREIDEFWSKRGVVSTKVPNFSLLEHFREYALRHVLQEKGGTEAAGRLLGVATIPGQWNQAIVCEEVIELQRSGHLDAKLVGPKNGATPVLTEARKDWPSQTTLVRGLKASNAYRTWNYWCDESRLIAEIRAFAKQHQEKIGLPPVWLPRSVDMCNCGRRDIVNAMHRAGGFDVVAARTGLVHHVEWRNFLGQLETLRGLERVVTVNGEVSKVLPPLKTLKEAGEAELAQGLTRMGGMRLVASKMGMDVDRGRYQRAGQGMHFGNFDLSFAIDLLEFIFKAELEGRIHATQDKKGNGRRLERKNGPTIRLQGSRVGGIVMPGLRELHAAGSEGRILLEQIERYGGFENVARRLHLEFSDEDELAFRRRKGQQLEDTHRGMHAALVRQQEKLLRRREECVQRTRRDGLELRELRQSGFGRVSRGFLCLLQ